jgi:hypothetical protein
LHIAETWPRVAAWSWKLLDKLISLDTNRDGSFGKLKVWGSSINQTFYKSIFLLHLFFFIAPTFCSAQAFSSHKSSRIIIQDG